MEKSTEGYMPGNLQALWGRYRKMRAKLLIKKNSKLFEKYVFHVYKIMIPFK